MFARMPSFILEAVSSCALYSTGKINVQCKPSRTYTKTTLPSINSFRPDGKVALVVKTILQRLLDQTKFQPDESRDEEDEHHATSHSQE